MKEMKNGILKLGVVVLLSVFMIVFGSLGFAEEVAADDVTRISSCPVCRSGVAQTTTVQPTCRTEGTVVVTCKNANCGWSTSGKIGYNQNNHTWNRKSASCTENKKCKECGVIAEYAKHDFQETSRTEPGCVTDGTIYRKCTKCGATDTQPIQRIGSHNYTTKRTEPTCGADGIAYDECSRCGDKTNYKTLSATGLHKWEEIGRTEPGCFTDGTIYLECSVCKQKSSQGITQIGKHNITKVRTEPTCGKDGSIVETCSRCDYEKTTVLEATGLHDWKETKRTEPGCFTDGTIYLECTVCKQKSTQGIKQIGSHNISKVRTEPTCVKDGSIVETCSRCDYEKTTVLEATGLHDWKETKRTEPGCFTGGTIYLECSVCKQKSTQGIKQIGSHNITKVRTEPTCVKDGSIVETCSRCDYKKTTVLEATGLHDWKETKRTEPGCFTGGTIYLECTVCKQKSTQGIKQIGSHNISKVRTEPTCGKDGSIVETCSRCDYKKTTVLKATGLHDWKETKRTEPGCFTDGTIYLECSVCKQKSTQGIKQIGSHNISKVRTEPTCGKDGSIVETCSRCDYKKTTVLEATGLHNWKETGRNPAGCYTDGTIYLECTVCKQKSTQGIKRYGSHNITKVKTEPTCVKDGSIVETCSRCAYTNTTVLKATGLHNWIETDRKEAGCYTDGTIYLECSVCKKKNTQGIKRIGSHNITKVRTEPTCGADGSVVESCSRCDYTNTTVLKATGIHKWEETDRVEATCDTDGTVYLECSVCKKKRTQGIDRLGEHSYTELVSDTATCIKAGDKTWKCTKCGKTKIDPSPAKGHDFKEVNGVSVCTVCGETKTITHPNPTETTSAEDDTTAASTETQTPETTEEETSPSETESESASLPALSADNRLLVFSEVSDTKQIKLLNLVKDSSIQVSISGTASSWIKVGGSGSVYTVRALENTGNSVRKGVITFTDTSNGRSVNIEVQQSNAKGCVVSFNVNGGRGQIYLQSKTVVPGTSMKGIFPAKVDAPAYKMFDGWYTAPEGGVRYNENSICPNTDRLTLFAHWKDKTYYIAYDGNGAEKGSMANTPAVCNTKVELAPNAFIKSGYIVEYWTTMPDGSGTQVLANNGKAYNLVAPYAEPGTVVTLYAKWTPKKDVQVSFDANGGSIVENGAYVQHYTKNVEYKQAYGKLPTAAHPQGLIFGGWKDEMGRIVDEKSTVFNANNHTLRAVWAPKQYTIRFDGNNNISGRMDDLVFQKGDNKTLPDCLFDDGVKFDCWCTAPDRSGYTFAAGASVDEVLKKTNQTEITLYALWYEHEYSIVYLDGFTGQEITRVDKSNVGHKYSAIDAPAISGLRFAGWMLSENFPLGVLPLLGENGILAENLYFTAGQYKVIDFPKKHLNTLYVYSVYERSNKNAYSIIYHPYDGYNCPKVDDYDSPGKKSVTTSEPNKDGFVFSGWLEYPGVTGTYKKEVELSDSQRCVVLYPDWIWIDRMVTLKDGMDGKKDIEIPMIYSGETTFTLSKFYTLKRDDYTFGGWKAKDGTIYSEGSVVTVPEKGLELTATWERRKYTIEYYDSYTGQLLFTETLKSDEALSYIPPKIGGAEFSGWIYHPELFKSESVASGALVSSFVDTGSERYLYKMESSYKEVEKESGKITVIYIWNGKDVVNGPTEPTYGNITNGEIELTDVHPDKKGCIFNGWSYSKDNIPEIDADRKTFKVNIYPKEASPVSFDQEGHGILRLYACWKSQYSCVLDPNGYPGISNTITISGLPGTEVNLSDYSKLFKKKGNSYLSGWGETKDDITYSSDDTFTIPYQDYVLYAIPKKKECTIKYMDGFSGNQIGSVQTVNMGDAVTPPAEAPFYSGYEFIGWSYDVRDMRFDWSNAEDADIPIGESITIKESIELYATYRKDSAPEGTFRIVYNPNGGEGGPGTVLLTPSEHTVDVTHVPSYPGYTFEGWHPVNYRQFYVLDPEFPKDSISTISPDDYGMDVTLYAVWKEDEGNVVRDILKDEYDASKIADDHFLREYTSSEWEQIDGKTYYIVRTKRVGDSQASKSFISTAFVLKFENGDWVLRSYGTKETLYENIKLNILMSHTNDVSAGLEFAFMVAEAFSDVAVDAVSVYCPAFGYVVKGAKYMGKIEELMKTREEYEELSEFVVDTLKDEVVDLTVDKIKGEMLGRAIKIEAERGEVPEKILGSMLDLFISTEQAIANDFATGSEGMDPFGAYDRALEIFRNRVSSNGFEDLANKIPDCVTKIFVYVNQR